MIGTWRNIAASLPANEPGMAVRVILGGRRVLSESVGLADLEARLSFQSPSVFRIASLSKAITAAGVLLLAQQGRVRLDDPVTRSLRGLPGWLSRVNIYHLLSHTSGLLDYTERPDFGLVARRDLSPRELVAYCCGSRPAFPPGATWGYSNSDYVLLGAVIEQATGMGYEHFLVENFSRKLGLQSLAYDVTERIVPGRVHGYSQANGTWKNASFMSMTLPYAAGGLLASADDLGGFFQALLQARLLEQRWLDFLLSPVAVNNGVLAEKSIAGDAVTVDGHLTHQHSGQIKGFSSYSVLQKEAGLVVVCLANSETDKVRDVANRLAQAALGPQSGAPR